MSEQENIKNKFSNFEPEVEDSHIEKSWEKVKYFVPQEEKKRRGFFFLLTGYWAVGFTAFGLIASLFTFYVFTNNGEIEKQVVQQTHSTQEGLEQKEMPSKMEDGKKIEATDKSSINSKSTNESTLIPHSNLVSDSANEVKKIPSNADVKAVKNEEVNKVMAYSKQIASPIITNKKTSSNIWSNSSQIEDSIVAYTNPPALKTDKIDPFILVMNSSPLLGEVSDPELVLKGEILPSIEKLKYKPTLYVYAIGGANQINNQFTNLKTQVKDSKNTLNYFGALGIMYALQKRFYLVSQLGIASNSFGKTERLNQNELISKKAAVLANIVFPDTILYKEVKTEYRLEVKNSYRFALGFEYEMAKWRSFSMGVFALGDVAYTQVNQIQESSYTTPVLIFLTSPTNTTLPNQAPSDFKEEQVKQTSYLTAYGINTGISLNYGITPRLAIITRPSYGFQVSNETRNWLNRSFQLNQNQFFLNLGIRFKL